MTRILIPINDNKDPSDKKLFYFEIFDAKGVFMTTLMRSKMSHFWQQKKRENKISDLINYKIQFK
jgi:hypothetical protein